MNNRIINLFKNKQSEVLNIYFTAGFPSINDTTTIIKALDDAGADLVEIGMPFSDPLADGPTIQASNEVALANGMTIKLLFEQLKDIRQETQIPIVLMGYINPVMTYGVKAFLKKCKEVGVDGLILPDLPMEQYEKEYQSLFEETNLSNVFLITPQTSEKRLARIDEVSSGFIYAVSTNSTTGNDSADTTAQKAYFERIQASNLKNPVLIGFNIKDNATFSNACNYANGAIIGSAFINTIRESNDLAGDITAFVKNVRG